MLRLFQSRLFSTLKVPIESIKKLREHTSAPLGQCKKALEENDGDLTAALSWLKKKGMKSAEKRSDKDTREGVIGAMVSACRSKVALVQVNCETDFVAKNELFLNFVNNIMYRAIEAEYLLAYENGQIQEEKGGIDAFLEDSAATQLFPEDQSVENLYEQYKLVISRLQQNIRVRRVITMHSDKQKYGVYVHQAYEDNTGLQAAVVELDCEPELDEENESEMQTMAEFADNIATQVLGSPPKYLRQDDIPQEVLLEEKEKVKEEMAQSLKKAPQKAHDKIIGGKLHTSFYSVCVLPKMNYLLSNSEMPVEEYWRSVEKELNRKIEIRRSWLWECK